MKIINIVTACILGVFLTACNSTPKPMKLVKKPLVSDHYLLMSLMNRPVTADQQLMLAFQQQRESYYGDVFVNAVSLKGPKLRDNSAPINRFEFLINNDINAIDIQGPITKANDI
jgi:hypothetical protein